MGTYNTAIFFIGAALVVAAIAWATALQGINTPPTVATLPYEKESTTTPQNPSQQAQTPISLTLEISPTTAPQGASVNAVLTLTNTGTTAINIEYFIGQLFEIIVKDEEGSTVYRLSDTTPHRYMMSRPLQLILNTGETYRQQVKLRLVNTHGQPLPPGTYTATAYLTAGVEHHPPAEGYEAKAAAKSNPVQIIIITS